MVYDTQEGTATVKTYFENGQCGIFMMINYLNRQKYADVRDTMVNPIITQQVEENNLIEGHHSIQQDEASAHFVA